MKQVYVPEGIGVVQDARQERFRKVFYVKGASFEGWYDERDIVAAESEADENLDLTYVDDDEMEEDPIPRESAVFTEDFIPFGTVSAAEFDPVFAEAKDDGDAPEVIFDEDAEPAEDDEAKIAAWRDVQQKAKRLRQGGNVSVEYVDELMITGQVTGDNDTYATSVYRGGRDLSDRKMSTFRCSCKWGEWVHRRGKYFGRLCSHGLAMYYEMQSNDAKLRRSSGQRVASASEIARLVQQELSGVYVANDGLGVAIGLENNDGQHSVVVSSDGGDGYDIVYTPTSKQDHASGDAQDVARAAVDMYRENAGRSAVTIVSPDGMESATLKRPFTSNDVMYWLEDWFFDGDDATVDAAQQLADGIVQGRDVSSQVSLLRVEIEYQPGYTSSRTTSHTSPVGVRTGEGLGKTALSGREAVYGGTTVIIREILSNNRVAVSYPGEEDIFVVMDEDLYPVGTDTEPWLLEAGHVTARLDNSTPGMDYADDVIDQDGFSRFAAEDDEESGDDAGSDDDSTGESDSPDGDGSADADSDSDSSEEEEVDEDEDAKTARMARAFLKEAGKAYTLEEQQALIDEDGISHESIQSLNLEGTHYINDELILP